MPFISFKKRIFYIAIIAIGSFMSSCITPKSTTYFQNDYIDQATVKTTYQTVFKPDDLLQITVSSPGGEAALPFNLPAVAFSASTNAVIGQPRQQNYLIDRNGVIDFPILGELKIGGLTREQAIAMFKSKLSPKHLKNPTINIRISNFKITVQGDVQRPGTFNIPNERITIMDAFGLAGDLNISGKRDNILVIREENGKRKEYRINLLSRKAYSSPVYFLQQNDVVYVEPNKWKTQTASTNQNTGLIISGLGLIITIIALITR